MIAALTRLVWRFVPDTIAGRTTAVLLAGLVFFHLASIWAYQVGINTEIDVTNDARLAERLYTIKRAVELRPEEEREDLAHSLSGGPLEVHWSLIRLTVEGGNGTHEATLRDRLRALAPELTSDKVIFGAQVTDNHRPVDPHLIFVSLQLRDGTWVNVSVTKLAGPHSSVFGVVLSTTLMAFGVLAASVLVLRMVTKPVQICADAAGSLYRGAEPSAIDVTGPREVRNLASAFNSMQDRVKRLVESRTLTLAAISHDLKSPLARLSLRAESVPEPETRRQMNVDIAEMLAMIDSALEFLKGDFTPGETRNIDVTAILVSLCNDWQDMGKTVDLKIGGDAVLRGHPLALKRAFANLIDNAVKYGGNAVVEVSADAENIRVLIADSGPGVPETLRETVFAPFFRGEDHRNTDIGGAGLGLTIARTAISAHGGEITLQNGAAGGLEVTVTLPKSLKVYSQQ
ncbi:MAG: ATP-binding protein [Hyphomicrobiales bacterium]|nr:ATP-binding protein [Hyphomicrobiales bacterium]